MDRRTFAQSIGAAAASAPLATLAQSPDNFVAGKTLQILVGSSPGGYYDIGARVVARHLPRFLPGASGAVVQNMPSAGGLSLANRMAGAMDRDGLTIVCMNRALPQWALLDDPNVTFDPLKLNWLGSLTSYKNDGYLLIVNERSPVKSVADARAATKTLHLGGTLAGATNIVFALIARDMLKMNVDLVRGFPGVAEVWLAMERDELDGQVIDLSAILVGRPALWAEKKLRPLMVFGRTTRMPEAPDAPTGRELVTDPADLALLEFAELPFFMALPFALPQGVPPERVKLLGAAFMKMADDAEFQAEINKAGILTSPVDGNYIIKLIEQAARAPKDVRARFARLLAM